ncbi:MAG: hypothetical protein ACLFQT_05855 [Thiohalophilus sp.]
MKSLLNVLAFLFALSSLPAGAMAAEEIPAWTFDDQMITPLSVENADSGSEKDADADLGW